jgi:hypothetical protein
MGIGRLLRGSLGTLLVGMLAGFVIAAAISVIVQDSGMFGASGESPIARAYMLGLLQRDPSSMAGIRPNQSISRRAAELQGADTSRTSTSIQPLSLTYIGGAGAGSYSVHIYAVGLRSSQGVNEFFSLALTVSGGKVIRSE